MADFGSNKPPPPKMYTKQGFNLLANAQPQSFNPNNHLINSNIGTQNNASSGGNNMFPNNQSNNIFFNKQQNNSTIGIFNNSNNSNSNMNAPSGGTANSSLNMFSNAIKTNSNSPFITANNMATNSNNNPPWLNIFNSKNNVNSSNTAVPVGNIFNHNLPTNNMTNNKNITQSPFMKNSNMFSNINNRSRVNNSVTMLKNQIFEPIKLVGHQKLKQNNTYVNCIASHPQYAKKQFCKDEVRVNDYITYFRQTGSQIFHQPIQNNNNNNNFNINNNNIYVHQPGAMLQTKRQTSNQNSLEYSFFGNLIKSCPNNQYSTENNLFQVSENINTIKPHPLSYNIYDSQFYSKVQERIQQLYTGKERFFNLLNLFSGEGESYQKFFKQFHPNMLIDLIKKYQYYIYLKKKQQKYLQSDNILNYQPYQTMNSWLKNTRYSLSQGQSKTLGLDRFESLPTRQKVDQFYNQYIDTELGSLFSNDQSIKQIFFENKALMYKILQRHEQIQHFLGTKTSQLLRGQIGASKDSNGEFFQSSKRKSYDFRYPMQKSKKISLFSNYQRQKYLGIKSNFEYDSNLSEQSDEETITIKLSQIDNQAQQYRYPLKNKLRFKYQP